MSDEGTPGDLLTAKPRGGKEKPPMWLGDRISCYRMLGFYGTCNNDFEKLIKKKDSNGDGITADAMYDILNDLTAPNAKVLLRILALHIVVRRAVTMKDSKGEDSRNREAVDGIKKISAYYRGRFAALIS